MKPAVALIGFVFLTVPTAEALAQVPSAVSVISVARTMNGCDITLPPEVAKTVQDQVWLVVDGNPEGFGGGFYFPDAALKPLHYTASVSNNLDGQVKDILKAQGFLVKDKIITYHVSFGVNQPDSGSISKTLRFRHGSNILAFTQYPATATYKIGDKIPVFEAVALDSSVATSGILGESAEKQNQLPHDLLHRITIQVQFVPKPK